MGNTKSLKKNELKQLLDTTNFSKQDANELLTQYKTISKGRESDATMDRNEFYKAIGRAPCLFIDRIFELFDTDQSDSIDLREFIVGISTICADNIENKLKFSFSIYDLNGDGFIDRSELRKLVGASTLKGASSEELDNLVNSVMREADSNCDGRISYDEFKVILGNHPAVLDEYTTATTFEEQDFLKNILKIPVISTRSKVVLLGPGDGGKSTLLKVFRNFSQNCNNERPLVSYNNLIKENLIEWMKLLLLSMKTIGLKVSTKTIEPAARISILDSRTVHWSDGIYTDLKLVWRDENVQLAMQRGNEIQIPYSLTYFMNNLERINHPEYLCTNEDVLRIKIKTTGLSDNLLRYDNKEMHIIDTGGQSNERKKWKYCYDGASCVVFVVDITCYSMQMYEHEEQNRMIDSIRLFGETVRAKELSNIPVILVLNKVDELEVTLQKYPLKQLFPEYIGRGVTNAIEYISTLFLKEHQETKILVSTLTDPVLAKETANAIVSTI